MCSVENPVSGHPLFLSLSLLRKVESQNISFPRARLFPRSLDEKFGPLTEIALFLFPSPNWLRTLDF